MIYMGWDHSNKKYGKGTKRVPLEVRKQGMKAIMGGAKFVSYWMHGGDPRKCRQGTPKKGETQIVYKKGNGVTSRVNPRRRRRSRR